MIFQILFFCKNIISTNPFSVKGLISIPKSFKQDKKVESLTIDEQKLFINEVSKKYDPYSNIFIFALFTGMRIGEILALSKDDIDLENNIITIKRTQTKDINDKPIIGKTTKTYAGQRIIPITPLIKPIILEQLNSKDELLFNNSNSLISNSTINAHIKRISKRAGIQKSINTHMLRHTYATRCIESGMQAVVLQKLLGHKDIQVTLNIYTSVFDKFKNDEIDKYLEYISQLH